MNCYTELYTKRQDSPNQAFQTSASYCRKSYPVEKNSLSTIHVGGFGPVLEQLSLEPTECGWSDAVSVMDTESIAGAVPLFGSSDLPPHREERSSDYKERTDALPSDPIGRGSNVCETSRML
ncbi:hypothetical protein STEG23_026262, partial [Scotinomys teguina]